MEVCIIDCDDSFTLNISDYLSQCLVSVKILHYKEATLEYLLPYQGIVLSPGPKKPSNIPILYQILDKFQDTKHILGICLGHQAIGEYYGHEVVKSHFPVHGIPKEIRSNDDEIFKNMPDKWSAMRYNSLTVKPKIDSPLVQICHDEFGDIMGFKHSKKSIYSFQFHPESIGTPFGIILFQNWVNQLNNKK